MDRPQGNPTQFGRSAGKGRDKGIEQHATVSKNQVQTPVNRSISMEDAEPRKKKRVSFWPIVGEYPAKETHMQDSTDPVHENRAEGSVQHLGNGRKPGRASPTSSNTTGSDWTGSGQIGDSHTAARTDDSVQHWVQNGDWPKKRSRTDPRVDPLLIRAKPVPSLNFGGTDLTEPAPSDRNQKVEKSKSYSDPRYEKGLASRGSFMTKSPVALRDSCERLCQILLKNEQCVPINTKFDDAIFEKTLEMIRYRNESKIIIDIGRLVVPSAETLALYGCPKLDNLIESFNESWIKSVPFYGPQPQPDYSVGYRRSAFSNAQLEKLQPYLGSLYHLSYFMATDEMYFPFLTSEVQSSVSGSLDMADRQNAHSMTIAARGVIELFRAAKREQVLNREMLGFSISHDAVVARIYAHFVLIDGEMTMFYRHPIRQFYFADGKQGRWIANRFTRNVYEVWAPNHLQRIRLAIDHLPSLLGPDGSIS